MTNADWDRRQNQFARQGISRSVLLQLVSANAQNLLPGRRGGDHAVRSPFASSGMRQRNRPSTTSTSSPSTYLPESTQLVSAIVEATGARVFPIRLPAGYSLVIGANGTPLLQMGVFGADGSSLEARGPLRVVTLGAQKSSPVQLLITNEGVAQAEVRLQLRADPPPPPAPPAEPPPEAELESPAQQEGGNVDRQSPAQERRPRIPSSTPRQGQPPSSATPPPPGPPRLQPLPPAPPDTGCPAVTPSRWALAGWPGGGAACGSSFRAWRWRRGLPWPPACVWPHGACRAACAPCSGPGSP